MEEMIDMWQGIAGIGRWIPQMIKIEDFYVILREETESHTPTYKLDIKLTKIIEDEHSDRIVKIISGQSPLRCRFHSSSKKDTFISTL